MPWPLPCPTTYGVAHLPIPGSLLPQTQAATPARVAPAQQPQPGGTPTLAGGPGVLGSVRCQSAAAHPALQLVTALGRALNGMRFAGDYFLDLSGQQRLGCPDRANYSNKHLLFV